MKLKFAGILFAVVVCASVANAERTTSTQAMAVARAIVARGTTMGERLGSTVESVAESPDATAPFFAVKMRGGGTIITSGDTEIDPIIAILPGGEDFKNIPEGHPLLALLKRDLALRQRVVDDRANLPVVLMMSASVNASAKTSRGKWEKLLAEDESRNRPHFMSMMSFVDGADEEGKKYDPEPDSAAITDMRVEPLVKAQWSQSGGGENEFTPEHSVCGCVATATAQIMHKFQWPTNDVIPFKNTCSFNGVESEYTARGGAYDWANMPNVSAGSFGTEAAAIGQLTYNCGVAVGMMWTPRSSGAYAENLPAAYEKLGYAQALIVSDFTGGNLALHSMENLEKYVFPSLDAGSPVQISICDDHYGSGHSIVGDGYGFIEDEGEKIAYIHINMGWGANSGYNAWYNFPTVPYSSTIDGGVNEYAIIKGFIYNILPEFPKPRLSSRSAYILSGRAMDEEGNPIVDAEVQILNEEGIVVSVVTTQAHGVWGAVLGCEGPLSILAHSEANNISGEIAGVPFLLTQNSWGNDIELTNFSVENKTTGELYSSLNRAIMNAADKDVLEVFTQSVMNVSCKIDKELTICSRAGIAPEIRGVSVAPSVQLNVASNGVLKIENLTFRRGARNFDTRSLCTDVASNGCLRIENVNGLEEITLHDSKSFIFAGSVTNPIYIVSKDFPCTVDAPFGSYEDADAEEHANYLLNDADDELGGIAKEDGTLVWGNASIPDAAASVRLDQDGTQTNYRTFAALLRHCTGDAAIEVVKSSVLLDEELAVSNKVAIFSRGTTPAIKATENAHFAVEGGGELLITNVIVAAGKKKKGSALFDINGGTITLERGASIEGFNHADADAWSGAGAIQLTSGHFTLRPGAAIRNCSTGGNGGAIFATGGVVAIEGGQIQNCQAKGMYGGGGIFAYVPETQIQISGSPVISDNIWYTNNRSKANNLHLEENRSSLASAPIDVVGDMGVNAWVGLTLDQYMTKPYGGKKGNVFATASSMMSEAKAITAHAFVNDAAPEDLMAAWSEDETELLWVENTLKGEVAPGWEVLAAVRTTDAEGAQHLYYNLRDAFQYMKGPSDVELLVNSVEMFGGLTIPYDVTIRTMSETNEVFAISHIGDDSGVLVVPAGISLTLTNINFLCTGESHQRAIDVKGGRLTLEADALVSGYTGGVLDVESLVIDGTRASSAIVVWNGGTFTMMGGAVIANCRNTFLDDPANVNEGAGGAVLIDGATGYFLGGVITNCSAAAGGAVALCNESVAYVSGDLTIAANTDRVATEDNAAPSDFVVENLCKVYLAAPFAESARVGRLAGFKADTNLVAYVENWQGWDFTSLTNSAAKFFNDEAVKVHGFVVTNESDTALVVWSTSIAEDGSFVRTDEKGDLVVYHAVAAVPAIEDDPPPPVVTVITNTPTPIAFKSITRISETEWQLVVTDLVEKCEYALTYMENLEEGFSSTGTWMKAESSGPWTTNIVFEAEKPVYFWKALGRETYEEKTEE